MSNGRLYTSISCTGVQFLAVKLQLKLERMYVSYIKKDKYCPSATHVNVLFRGPPLVFKPVGTGEFESNTVNTVQFSVSRTLIVVKEFII